MSLFGAFDRIFTAMAREGVKIDWIIIGAGHLKAHRAAASQSREDPIKCAKQAPADTAIVKGLVRAIGFGDVLPLQAVLSHVNDPADHAAVI